MAETEKIPQKRGTPFTWLFSGGAVVWTIVAALIIFWERCDSQHSLVIVLVWLLGTAGLWFSLSRLRASEDRYRQQIRQSHAIMLIIDPDNGAIVDANPAACDFYGHSHAELMRLSIYNINCAATEVVRQSMVEVADGTVPPFQVPHCRADGSIRDVEVFSSPIMIEGKKFLHAIVFDITSRLAAERQLRDKMDFAENLLQNSAVPTFVVDADRMALIWNRALEELTGVRAQDVVGTKEYWRAFYRSVRPCLVDFVLDGTFDEAPEQYPDISRSRLIPDGLHSEGNYIFKNRECRLMFSSAPIRDRDGKVIAAIETLEDTTERIYLEEQLLQTQKMESIGVLAGGIVHDFNNVLTVIKGYADLLKMTLPDDVQNMAIAREISDSVERATEMTRSLQALSGKHGIQLNYDELNQILVVIHKSLGRLIREDIALTINPCEEPLPVFVDRIQMEQVLINLVVNARDASGSGGAIFISTATVHLTEPRTEGKTIIPPGLYGCLTVRDNGSGITSENLERIFEPFFTTKKMGQGTGLGLAIVHNIVTKHNGCISVTSTPGSGTEFRVYLPLYAGDRPEEIAEVAPPRPTSGTETVLVIEDDAAIMRLHREILIRNGYVALLAADGVEGIKVFKAHRNEIRIAIIDVILPLLNGREVAEQIRRLRPDLPIIMTSGYTEDIIDRAAIESLNVIFLQKPVRPIELLKVIGTCLENQHNSASQLP
jgi:PAS domain S-box-containing protein